MKIEISAEKLKSATLLASRFTSRGAQLEALQGILLIAEGKTLTLRATNLECGVEISIAATIQEPGLMAVQAAPFAALISNLSSNRVVSLADKGSVLSLTTERSSTNIKTVSHEDFPILPTVSAENSLVID